MQRFLKAATARFVQALFSNAAQVLTLGAATGAMVLAWCFQWTVWFGTSPPVVSALALAFLLGLELAWRPWTLAQSPRNRTATALGFMGYLVVWSLGFPWFVEWQSQLIGAFSPTQMASPAVALAVLFVLALAIVTPPVFAAARLPFLLVAHSQADRNPKSQSAVLSLFAAGLAAGGLISAYLLAPRFGLATTSIAAGLVGVAVLTVKRVRQSVVEDVQAVDVQSSADEANLATARWEAPGREIWTALMLITMGGAFAWFSRMLDQFIPATILLACAKWSCLALGWAAGLAWGHRRFKRSPSVPVGSLMGFFVGTWVVLAAAAFPWVIEVCLNLTVYIAQVSLLTLSRFLVVFALIFPLGFAWGIFSVAAYQLERQKAHNEKDSSAAPAVPLLAAAFLAGWLLGQWVLVPYTSMTAMVVGFACVCLGLGLVRIVFEPAFPKRWALVPLAVSGLLMATSFIWAKNYNPAISAELLFAAPVFTAKHAKLDAELLTALDEGRLVATREGQAGTYTLWKYRGVQYQLRQSGLPKGMISSNTLMCPDFTAEVMPAALPLALHERPESLLVLGLGSGAPVTTGLAFPTQSVTCIETDPALVELVKTQIWPNLPANPMEDPRLTLLPLDPALWLRTATGTFDVIVSQPHQATLLENAGYFTKAFYRDAARKLTEDGYFCQRFTFIDFGPNALRIAAQTLQSVFRDVVFLEMAGGEMLLIGTNSPLGVAREGLMERLQREHVRRQLGQLGWDWSVPLNLTAMNHESLTKFSAENRSWRDGANTSANGTLAFRLPREMMRWGPKPQENHEAMAQHTGRFAEWGGIDPQDPDLLRRLAEITGQRQLMAGHPDEYWAYRKAVKEQVTKRPRTTIVQVKGELPRQDIHPDEKRRLAYFRALGETLKQHPHRLEDIAKVEGFSEPYDPLMTFFLHQEAAELHTRVADRNYAAELGHRIHSVYFASPQDRSVRNITSALEILCDYPEACAAPVERWDHLNGLVQMLKLRWAMRAGVTPSSTEIALNDVDKSLAAANRAIRTMDDLRADAGVDPEDWQARRRFLETTVVHPLRAYRKQLSPFHDRERMMKEKKEAASNS